MKLSEDPLIDAESIAVRTQELAGEIKKAYPGSPPLCLCVLKGSLFFCADLLRHLDPETEADFIRARSYEGTESTGDVTLTQTPEIGLEGRDVLIIEDIVDTGRSAAVILDWVKAQGPASVRICTLLDKRSKRAVAIQPEFIGFRISDFFVVGYGMDYNELYRGLPAIYALWPE